MSDDPRGKSRAELAVELLKAYRNWIGLAALLVVGVIVAALTVLGISLPEISLGREQKVFLLSAVLLGLAGYFPLVKIYQWLYDPPKRYLVQPAVSDDEGGIYELSPTAFENLTVKGGQLYQWPGMKYPTYGVEWYDPETNFAKASWRGSASDEELLKEQEKIDEIRDYLEEKAKERDVLVTRAETIVREAVMANARLLVQEYNRASLLDVTALSDRIDDVLEQVDLTAELNEQDRRKTDPETDPADPDLDPGQPTRTPAATDGGTDEQ
ncbi:hypothetical protein [Halapricum desulfuricans]|uniref:DUF8125 domain-containing protein n=1 Tax=Halapricum desulfuricans TaxID=2841257 RepID=A0A897N4P2_9EURY|nr:hypothetical protein [Halapricum desulfuricans]QSG05306.1 hypothetical protein HSR121_0958 [Halapricum desulfuricans]